jgi:hypothetical protein
VPEGERVAGSWVASIPFKRFDLAMEGGNLVLTDQHLLFRPLRVPLAVGDWFVLTSGRPKWMIPLSEVRAVAAVVGKRSQLRIETEDGTTRNVIIAAKRTAFRGNPQNAVARDEAVAAIGTALAGSAGAPS